MGEERNRKGVEECFSLLHYLSVEDTEDPQAGVCVFCCIRSVCVRL